MSDDAKRTGPGEEPVPRPDEKRDTGPDEERDTDLTRLDGLPTSRADPFIERVKVAWDVRVAGFANRLTLEASAPSQGMVSLAMSLAVVMAFGGGFAAVLIVVGAPAWPTLTVAALPVFAFTAATARRHRVSRQADAGFLGRRGNRGQVGDDGGNGDPSDP